MNKKNTIAGGTARLRGAGWLRAVCPLLIIMLVLSACNPGSKQLNRRVTLWRKDKIPYGTYIAFENLSHIFPKATISINTSSPALFEQGEGKKAYIIIVPGMLPDSTEMNGILNFVGQGNIVFISSFVFGDSLIHSLNIKPAGMPNYFTDMSGMRLSVHSPVNYDLLSFAYPGDAYDNYARSIDSQYTTILGRDGKGRPDFVRFNYKGGGALYLHFAPMAFTNFFLLHKGNMAYYDNVFSYLPPTVTEVMWDEYFRYDRKKDFSAFHYILSIPSLRWAFWLLLVLFLLIYLFESKRRQRLIPVIEGLRNTSLDFVKTIGRLYYQRRDNHNLALKMVAHFQDHVRTRYNLPATNLDEEFVSRLSYKAGLSREYLEDIVTTIRSLQEQSALTDEALLQFNWKMKEFYKQI